MFHLDSTSVAPNYLTKHPAIHAEENDAGGPDVEVGRLAEHLEPVSLAQPQGLCDV